MIGVGMTKFTKPSKTIDYPQLGLESGAKALLDAGITYDAVEKGFACYSYGDSTCGQRVFYQLGEMILSFLLFIVNSSKCNPRYDWYSYR